MVYNLVDRVELMNGCYFGFFFSSRRRHTILQGDWSSDVCSSDLQLLQPELRVAEVDRLLHEKRWCDLLGGSLVAALLGCQLVGRRTGDGRDRRGVSATRAAGGARRAGWAFLP